jgi:hypothetical protein
MKLKKLIILAAALLLAANCAPAQTQEKKTENSIAAKQTDAKTDSSQDPYVVAPKAYRREFENERVRVSRVRYEAGEIIELHEHPKLPVVFVYLTDSGPIRFVHSGEQNFITTRPPVKTGGFRLGRPTNEAHKVESQSDQPSDFLRIELKDLTIDDNFRGRYPPPVNQTAENSEKVAFENAQLRVVRVTCAPRGACLLNAQKSPYLLVALSSSELKTAINDEALSNLKADAGQTRWIEAGERLRMENPGDKPVRFLRIEPKTAK